MKMFNLRPIVWTGIIIFILTGLTGSFLAGSLYASSRAMSTGHTASLVYFSAIHKDLAQQNYEHAQRMLSAAVDSHVGVVREVQSKPWRCLEYALPWTKHS